MGDQAPRQADAPVSEGPVLSANSATDSVLAGSDEGRWFRLMAQESPVLIWITDKAGRIFFGNKACCDFLGVTPQRISTEGDWSRYIHSEDYDYYIAAYRDAANARKSFVAETRVRRADGQWRYLATYAAPHFTDDGAFAGFVGSSPDVTERVLWDQRLIEADRAKNQFLAMLSHELRNPLAPIITGAAILKLSGSLSSDQQAAVDIIDRQAHNLARLVDDLIDIQRISNGKISVCRTPLCVAEVLRAAVEVSRPHLDKRRQQLMLRLPEEALLLLGDAVRLCQVFSNLINNASKFSGEATPIVVAAARRRDKIEVTVSDQGIGIDAVDLPRIFDVFAQAKPTGPNAHGGGLGLGLALAKGLVELHGGSIEAKSAGRGKGTQFTVWLPAAAPS